jgi:transcriptional regulator with XRE-family HTH domain
VDKSQGALAEALEISEKSIQRYETNKNMPDAYSYSLARLAAYFDVSTDYLLGLTSIIDEQGALAFRVFGGACHNNG